MKRYILSVSLLGCIFLAHCGAPDRTTATPVVSTGGTAGTSSDAGTGAVSYTLDNVCDLLPKQICELREPCCNASGVGFDRYHCEADEHDHCVRNTAAVAAGTMTFDPQYLPACLLEWQRLGQGCDQSLLPWNYASTPLRACRQAFRGTTPSGKSCWTDEECEMSTDPNVRVECYFNCSHEHRPAKDQYCIVTSPTEACSDGLYCAPSGQCKTAAAPGAACTITAFGSNCDPRTFCDPTTLTCVPKHDIGGDCSNKDQCTSDLCLGGVCQHSGPLFSRKECGKP